MQQKTAKYLKQIKIASSSLAALAAAGIQDASVHLLSSFSDEASRSTASARLLDSWPAIAGRQLAVQPP